MLLGFYYSIPINLNSKLLLQRNLERRLFQNFWKYAYDRSLSFELIEGFEIITVWIHLISTVVGLETQWTKVWYYTLGMEK